MIRTELVRPLIEMFNICPISENNFTIGEKTGVLKIALAKGYVINPLALNEFAADFVISRDMKYNSTFYKTWSDVANSTRLAQFIDQIIHYATAADDSQGFIVNTEPNEPEWTSYKVIEACTMEELFNRCMSMLQSGVALKSETVKVLVEFIIEYYKSYNVELDVDSIKNREALIIIADELSLFPKDGAKLFAFIVYKATEETMIVKNRELRKKIRANADKVQKIFMSLTPKQLMSLAGVFNRYKELFIAFKTPFSKKAINKISHLSKKYHKPMKRGFWETILANFDVTDAELSKELEKANNFKLIQVMQSIRERLLAEHEITNNCNVMDMYIVRNNKIFIKEHNKLETNVLAHWFVIYESCRRQVVKNLASKACKVKLPSQYTLACPTSEKNFIGDIPMGTSVKVGKESVVGIYWRNDWGTRDFDLSYVSIDGMRVGWNTRYTLDNNTVIYSGDIVNAPDGANEVLYFKDDTTTGLIKINRYNGKVGSKYRLFFGTDSLERFNAKRYDGMENYMVDPNNIQLEAEIHQGEMKEQIIGLIHDGNFYFYELSSGYSRVSHAAQIKEHKLNGNKANYEMAKDAVTQTLIRKASSFIPLKDILINAGFEIVDEAPDLDLTDIKRDTLIDLFSK